MIIDLEPRRLQRGHGQADAAHGHRPLRDHQLRQRRRQLDADPVGVAVGVHAIDGHGGVHVALHQVAPQARVGARGALEVDGLRRPQRAQRRDARGLRPDVGAHLVAGDARSRSGTRRPPTGSRPASARAPAACARAGASRPARPPVRVTVPTPSTRPVNIALDQHVGPQQLHAAIVEHHQTGPAAAEERHTLRLPATPAPRRAAPRPPRPRPTPRRGSRRPPSISMLWTSRAGRHSSAARRPGPGHVDQRGPGPPQASAARAVSACIVALEVSITTGPASSVVKRRAEGGRPQAPIEHHARQRPVAIDVARRQQRIVHEHRARAHGNRVHQRAPVLHVQVRGRATSAPCAPRAPRRCGRPGWSPPSASPRAAPSPSPSGTRGSAARAASASTPTSTWMPCARSSATPRPLTSG